MSCSNRWLLGAIGVLVCCVTVSGEAVVIQHAEGLVHGFLALRTLEGTTIADGDLIQLARGDSVTTSVAFHFKDGSLHEETAVYSQRHTFQLVSDHLVQRGPTFPQPNGALPTLLKNVRPDAPPKTLSFVAATPKPRLVKLAVTAAGQEPFSTGSTGRTATHYVLKVEIVDDGPARPTRGLTPLLYVSGCWLMGFSR